MCSWRRKRLAHSVPIAGLEPLVRPPAVICRRQFVHCRLWPRSTACFIIIPYVALMHIGLPGTTGIRKRGRKKLVDDLLVPFLAFPRFPYRPHYVDDDQPGECRTTAFHVQIPPVTACDQV